MTVYAVESNAGHLFVGANGRFADVTETGSKFVEDAEAIVKNYTDDWSVDWYGEGDISGEIIATYKDGVVEVMRQPGVAGQMYLGMD